MREIRRALATLLKTPASTSAAILALALGIGVNVMCLIPVSALLLHPLPYRQLSRIVALWGSPVKAAQQDGVSVADFRDLERQSRSFAQLAAYQPTGFIVNDGNRPDRVRAALVSPQFFSVLGMRPALGHWLSTERDGVVVSNGFWRSHLGSSPRVIGTQLLIEGSRYSVLAVMPDSFDFPLSAQIWKPFNWTAADERDRDRHEITLLGLLTQGISTGAAASECARIAANLSRIYPETNLGRTLALAPLRSFAINDLTNRFMLTLLGASLFVFLLACANVGNLQLAKAAQSQKEIVLRAALGASRGQIARTLLLESSLISLLAAGLGLLLASWHNDHTRATLPAVALRHVPGLRTMHIDVTVVALTFGLSLLAGFICGLPALFYALHSVSQGDMVNSLRDRSTAQNSRSGKTGMRSFLIVVEIGLALVLLVGAGLMVQTFNALLHRNQGFDPHNVLNAQLSLPPAITPLAFYRDLLQKLANDRRISAAGISSEWGPVTHLQIEGQPELTAEAVHPDLFSISPGYFGSLKIPVSAGRNFSNLDHLDAQHVVIVSNSLALRYWPHQNPLGQRMAIQVNGQTDWLTVVGISGDVIDDWFHGTAAPFIYVPYMQRPLAWGELDLRTLTPPMSVLPSLRNDIESTNRQVAIYEAATLEQHNFDQRSGLYAAASNMSEFAVIALLLSLTGIYSVVALFVNARTREIGVRIALGAKSSDVVSLAMSQMLKLIAIALACGIPLAILLSRGMSYVLYGVVALNPFTIAPLVLLLICCALLASYLPARRATGIDPAIALRD